MSAADQLMSRMMRRELFVVSNVPLVPAEDMQANLEAHLRYLIDLEQRGVLFASGPLFGAHGTMSGEGLTILRAGTLEEAERLAAADPFAIAGQRRPIVKRWVVNEGRITVSVDISNGTGALP